MRLNLRIKPKRRIPSRDPKPLAVPLVRNECWSVDFMQDSLDSGRKFRTFNVIDDYNREVLAVEIDFSLPSTRVIRVLEQAIEEHDKPKNIRMDNGPKFISDCITAWADDKDIIFDYIKPGKPAQNGYIERFNRTYRGDVFDLYTFADLDEVREITTKWMWEYNNIRPHSSLGGMPPRELWQTKKP